MKKVKKAYRHGDVILVKIGKLPKGCKKLNHRILAEGETTGHKHEVERGILYEKNGQLYLVEETKDIIKHEEHGVGQIDKEVYRIDFPQEWDYLEEERKRVMD